MATKCPNLSLSPLICANPAQKMMNIILLSDPDQGHESLVHLSLNSLDGDGAKSRKNPPGLINLAR